MLVLVPFRMQHCLWCCRSVGRGILSLCLEYRFFFFQLCIPYCPSLWRKDETDNIGKVVIFSWCIETSSLIIFNLEFFVWSKKPDPNIQNLVSLTCTHRRIFNLSGKTETICLDEAAQVVQKQNAYLSCVRPRLPPFSHYN